MTNTLVDRIFGLNEGVAMKANCRFRATSPITLSGLGTQAFGTPDAGDRVLVMGQPDSIDDGIYIADIGAWCRAPDFDGRRDAICGTFIPVFDPDDDVGYLYRLVTPDPITIGVSELHFAIALTSGGQFFEIISSFPQDDQPVEWSDAVGGFTNVLLGTNRVQSAQTTSDDNIDVTNPPGTIGGHDMEINQTVFLHAQTDAKENFLWVYKGDGLAMQRPARFPSGKGISAGKTVISITLGDHAGDYWQLISPAPTGTIGTSELDFETFEGGIFLRPPGVFSAGPSNIAINMPQSWRRIQPMDFPPGFNGDSTSFMSGGVSLFATMFRKGPTSGYWSQPTPWQGHSEVVQSGQYNRISEIDMPAIPLEQSISGSQLAALELISHSAGPDGVISLYVMGDYPALDLSGISSFKITGALRIKYRNAPAAGTHAVYVHGASKDIDLGDLYIENCADGLYISGTVDRVRARTLGVRNWTGYALSTQGTGTSAKATNIRIDRFLYHNDTAGGVGGAAVACRVYEWTGDSGVKGLEIMGGSGDGAFRDILVDASANTRQPQNCFFHNIWGKGATGSGVVINYGIGTWLFDNVSVYGAGVHGFHIAGANFTGELTLIKPHVSQAQQHGIYVAVTAYERIQIVAPRIKACSQATDNSSSGIDVITGANNFYVSGGIIGDQGGSARMQYGINIEGTSTFFEIDGVDVRGNHGTINNGNSAGTWIIKYCPGFTSSPWS